MAGPLPGRRHHEPLRRRYGWNTVDWTGPVPDDEVRELIDASYDAAVAALPKSRRPQVAAGLTAVGGRRALRRPCARCERAHTRTRGIGTRIGGTR